jgi:dolichyl-phosphate-mannose-protein mannosyltransferase
LSRAPRPAQGSKPRREEVAPPPARAKARAGGAHAHERGLREVDAAASSTPRDGAGARNAALAAVLGIALAIRVWKIGYGLPEFLDEALPFRWALAMWNDPHGRIDWNPHRFHHPSLPTYLHLFVQQAVFIAGRISSAYRNAADFHIGFLVDATPMALAARTVGIAADLATVFVTAMLAERVRRGAGWIAALAVAVSPTFVVAARSICSDSVMVPLAIAALERTLAYRQQGGRARLFAAAALIGLAAGSKYPAASLLLPLGVALGFRGGARELRWWPLAAAVAGAVFLATTPYAALDFATFQRDLGFLRGLAQTGHLGNLGERGFLFHMRNLARDLSWLGLALLAGSLAWTVHRARSRPDASLVWLALLTFGVPIALARIEAERYLLPILPLAAALAAEVVLAGCERLKQPARTAAVAAAVLALTGPALAGAARAVRASDDDTRFAARRWCEAHLTSDDLIVQELYCAPLLGRVEWLTVRGGDLYAAASPEMRARYDARRWFSSARLPLAVVGSTTNRVRPRIGPAVEVEVFPHPADLNHLVYDPRLLQRVAYFATSSAVRGRFQADTVRYAIEHRFYALLDSTAEVAARFAPRGAGGGPEIVIYHLGERAQQALAGLGPLDPLWWAEPIPRAYRERAESLLAPARPSGGEIRLDDGTPAAWVLSLRVVYQFLFSDFSLTLGSELADHGHLAEARRLAAATLVVAPEDAQTCMLYVACCARTGDWGAARGVMDNARMALAAAGKSSRTLQLTYGEVLFHLGDYAGARRALEALAASGDEIGAEARRRLEQMR